jgi:AraC-like DNA-binding protein
MLKVWDTRGIAPVLRAEFWRAAVCDAFLAMTPRIPSAPDFTATLEHLPIEQLTLNCVTSPAHGVWRTAHDLARGGRSVVFVNLPLHGRAVVAQHGRTHAGRAGDLMLIDATEPYRIDLPDGGRLLSLALPMDALRRVLRDLPARCAAPVQDSPATRLLQAQLRVLADAASPLPPQQAGMIADVLLQLVAAACTPEDAVACCPAAGSLIRRLRGLIDRHVDDPDYDPARAAADTCVSVRSVHAAFAHEGSSFSAAQMERRLQCARRRLSMAPPGVKVAEIARACGFRSASHFGRRFRHRFGCTPEQYRRLAG